MTKVTMTYNPYLVKTDIAINGVPIAADSELRTTERLQLWVDDFPEKLCDECNTKDFEIEFKGTELDFQDLYAAANVAKSKGIDIKLTKLDAKEFGDKETDIKDVFAKVRKMPFEELQSEALKDAVEKAFKDTLEVNVVATMSAGKSTLINALLRTKLMPSKNGACTAIITRIKDNDSSQDFSAAVYDKEGDEIEHCDGLTYAQMKKINSCSDVGEVCINGNIPFVDCTSTALVLIDTPGPDNARNEDHRKVTAKALDSSSKMLVLYVMNGTKLHDDAQDEFLRKIAKSMSVGGKQSKERFLFVINKMDCYDDDDDIAGETIPDTIDYLEEMGISSPNIFPVSAEMALKAYLYKNEQDTERKSQLGKELEQSAMRMVRQEQLHLEKYHKLPRTCMQMIEKELHIAEEDGDVIEQALIHSGIRGIEETIKMYVEKYCRPQKIQTVVENIQTNLEAADAFAKTTKDISSRESELKTLYATLDKLTKKLASKNANEAFKLKIKGLKIQSSLKEELNRTAAEFESSLTNFFNGKPTALEHSMAKAMVKKFVKQAGDTQAEFRQKVETLLKNDVVSKGNQLVAEYTKTLSMLSDELKIEGLKLDLVALAKGNFASFDPAEMVENAAEQKVVYNTVTKTRTVEKTRGWSLVFPWNWIPSRWTYEDEEEYDEDVPETINYISLEKIKNQAIPPVRKGIAQDKTSALDFAEKKNNELLENFSKRFDEVDKLLLKKAEELKKATSSKEAAEIAKNKAEKLLAELNLLKKELEAILEI